MSKIAKSIKPVESKKADIPIPKGDILHPNK